MKKTLSCIFFIFCWFISFGSTNITSYSVYGHWTLSGSPYLIHNDIEVPLFNSLHIDPGVSVIFQGAFRFNVRGELSAIGTMTEPINFTISDTSGWMVDNSSSVGGWHGIQFQAMPSSAMSISTLQFCNISFTKFDSVDSYSSPQLCAIYTNRNVNIRNCTFSNNKANLNSPIKLFVFNGTASIIQSAFFDNVGGIAAMVTLNSRSYISGNKFYNDSSFGSIINVFDSSYFEDNRISKNNSYGSVVNIYAPSYFNGNIINRNTAGQNIIAVMNVDFYFENNHLDSSKITSNYGGCSPLNLFRSPHAKIKNNVITQNLSHNDAAIGCDGGFIDIIGNTISNNAHTNGACGYTDGGGGIKLGCNGCVTDSCTFTIRNNVIANNYSPFRGGAIYATNARLIVTNNQIVNNKSSAGGGIFLYTYGYPLTFKNNIFYGNVTTPGTALTTPAIQGESFGLIEYNHNWTQHAGLFDLGIYTGYILSGSAAANIVGTSPGFIAPTITADFTEDAGSASFELLPNSPCINNGDDSAYLDVFDRLGNPRIIGGKVDIGAYEFHNFCVDTITGPNEICNGSSAFLSFPYGGGAWYSNQSLIVSIDPITGSITGNSPGETTVNYATGTCLAVKEIRVDTFLTPVVLTGGDTVCISGTVSLTSSLSGGMWSCTNSNASVVSGIVSGVHRGCDTVYYTLANICNSVNSAKIITVDSLPNAGVITGPFVVCPGATISLTNPESGGVWEVSNSYASIAGGTLTGLLPGLDTVFYTKNSFCGSSRVSYPVSILSFSECGTHPTGTILTPETGLKGVSLYPNPVQDKLWIYSFDKIKHISIVNIAGKVVMTVENDSEKVKVDVSSFPSGTYWVVINDSYTAKFVKM